MSTPSQRTAARQARKEAQAMTANEAAGLLRIRADQVATESYSLAGDDARDLRIIADLIANGDSDRAKGHADTLDTAGRELIPMSVWVFLGGDLIHG